MSIASESDKHEEVRNTESSVSDTGDSLSLFPDILRRAAYVSSGGRVYHLFSEEDEATVLNSPLGASLRIASTDSSEETEAVRPGGFVGEDTEKTRVGKTIKLDEEFLSDEDQSPIESRKTDDDVARFLSEIVQLEAHRHIPVDEAIRRKRGVEGVCGPAIRKPVIDVPQTLSDVFHEETKHDPRRGVPLWTTENERPTLKLAEVLPEFVVPERTEEMPEPPTLEQNRNRYGAVDTENAAADESEELRTDSVNDPETFPEPPASESPPETLPEPLKIRTENEQEPIDVPQVSAAWRLHWQPVWPEHLDSLEQDASGQIRSLVDHLETRIQQGSKVVSFNGYRPGDGCTTMSLCAARGLAERGYRILLADAHRQARELAQLLKLDIDPNLYEVMTLIPDRLELLPWCESHIEIDSREEIHSISFVDIVVSLRDEYDGIILDGGSLVESPLSEQVDRWRQMRSDGVLLVVNPKNPEPANVQAIAARLHRFDVELLGVAENYSSPRKI